MPLSKFATKYVRSRTTDRMGDTCRIFKPGAMVIDPVTKRARRENPEIKYEGRGSCGCWRSSAGHHPVLPLTAL